MIRITYQRLASGVNIILAHYFHIFSKLLVVQRLLQMEICIREEKKEGLRKTTYLACFLVRKLEVRLQW